MYQILKNFPNSIQAAIDLVKKYPINFTKHPIQNVLIAGMGSSGIAGNLVKNWVSDKLPIPLYINQDYILPNYVNDKTLLIIISHSGNTRELIENFKEGMKRQASMVLITSGGVLQEMARTYDKCIFFLPIHLPPRASIEYTLLYILYILQNHCLLDWDYITEFQQAKELILINQLSIQQKAKEVAIKINNTIPIIYSFCSYEAVATRLRHQLNENSKQLCWHHCLPELTHNEVVGWESTYDNISVICFNTYTENEKLKLQQKLIQEILAQKATNFILLPTQGTTHIVQSLYFIQLSDWISFYLAQEKGVDPMEVKYIKQIKADLEIYL